MMKNKKKKNIISLNGRYLKENLYNVASRMGEIYELYCYNYLLDNVRDINIVKSKCVKEGKYGNFEYSTNGKIIYVSNNIYLAEYDVLGMKSNNIYWWEITRHKKLEFDFIDKIKMKLELLGKLFKHHDIHFKLIAPKIYKKANDYEIDIIKEPLYELYFHNFKISNNIKNAMTLQKFIENYEKYDYIEDVIKKSKIYYTTYYSGLFRDEYLIKRVYNLETINSTTIEFIDVKNRRSCVASMIDDYIEIEGEKYNKRIKQEIIEIRKKIEKSGHCT